MAIDKLGIYNAVCRLCRTKKLASLSENRRPRRLIDDVWAIDPIKFCLEQGQWQFATKTVQITASTTIDPEFGYQYAFEKPSDCVRIVGLSFNEYFTEPEFQFADEQNYLYADIDTLYVKYVSDADDYGRDYDLWPPSFEKLVIAYISNEVVGDLTNSNTLADKIEKEYEKRLMNAQNKDGVNRPVKFGSRGSWNKARNSDAYSRGWGRDR